MSDPDFLYRDDSLAVVNKPGGLLTQAPPGIDSMELRLRHWLAANGAPADAYLGIPHRLDRPASGALLVGWTRAATRKLARRFEERQIEKTYWCVVGGAVQPESGQWSDWMRKVPAEARSEIVAAGDAEARWAVLQYRVLDQRGGQSWLQIRLETGRTHQIRLQCAARGVPILGDTLYGSRQLFGPSSQDPRAQWIALHARRLVIPGRQDPRQPLAIQAPLPDHWRVLQEQFSAMARED